MRCLKVLMGGSFFKAQALRAFSSRRESIPVVGREVMAVSDTSLRGRKGVSEKDALIKSSYFGSNNSRVVIKRKV